MMGASGARRQSLMMVPQKDLRGTQVRPKSVRCFNSFRADDMGGGKNGWLIAYVGYIGCAVILGFTLMAFGGAEAFPDTHI